MRCYLRIVETLCRPFLSHPLLNVSQHKFSNCKIKWKKRFYFERFCLWYHSSQQGITWMRVPKRSFAFFTEIRNFTVAPFDFLQWNTKFYSCTQTTFRFFYREMQSFENCIQTVIRFSQQNKKFSNVPKLPLIFDFEIRNF